MLQILATRLETREMKPPIPQVIIVAYGPPALLRAALDALGTSFRVYIVDNGLSNEVEALAAQRGLDYVRPERNLGFGAAVNLGLARLPPATDVLLLNPDARLQAADVLHLQDVLHAEPGIAAVAPRLVRPDGSVEQTRWPFPTPRLPWRGAIGRGALRPSEPYFLSGAVLLLSAQALLQVGAFDERFFLYAEESDWQRRALTAGFTVREAEEVAAQHLGAATSSDSSVRDRYFHGSAELYVRKWHGRLGWWVFRSGSLAAALRRVGTATSGPDRIAALRAAALYVRGPAGQLPRQPS